MFVLEPETIRYRNCNVVNIPPYIQRCFTDVPSLKRMSSLVSKLLNARLNWNIITGIACLCYTTRCNDISFRELFPRPLAVTPSPTSNFATTAISIISTGATDNEVPTTSQNKTGIFLIEL